MLPPVLDGCATWSLKHIYKLRVAENRAMRRIFVPEMKDVIGTEKTGQ
jgi:hypothetical protein